MGMVSSPPSSGVHDKCAEQKKSGRKSRPSAVGSRRFWPRVDSEDNLQRQLRVIRLAGTDAGRAVRDTDGFSARPEQGTLAPMLGLAE